MLVGTKEKSVGKWYHICTHIYYQGMMETAVVVCIQSLKIQETKLSKKYLNYSMNKKYQKISEETINKNSWWIYKHDRYKCDEKECDYFYGELNGCAIIVPILDDGRIAMIRQYRYLQDRS